MRRVFPDERARAAADGAGGKTPLVVE